MRYLIGLLFTVAACSAPPVIRGTILDSESGKPIAYANVRLTLTSSPEVVAEASTNDIGAFVLEEIPKGNYHLLASKDGYLEILANSPAQRSVTVTGETEVHATLVLTKAGVITGHVLDASGRPVRSARVGPIFRRVERGSMRLILGMPQARTDDRGIYRLYGLSPGRYIIAVTPGGVGSEGQTFAPLYFPGVSQIEKAQAILVRAGETRSAVDFLLAPAARYAVTGQVTGVPATWNGRASSVALFLADGYAAPLQMVTTNNEGRFRFDAVPAGSYELVAAGPEEGRGAFTVLLGDNPRYASQHLEVVAQDVAGIEIPLREGASLEGQLTLEPRAEAAPSCYPGTSVRLEPLDPLMTGSPPVARVNPQGGFRFPTLAAVRYRVVLGDLPNNCFVKEIRRGDQVLDDGVITPDGNGRLSVVLTTRAGKLTGSVTTGESPARGAAIILTPSGPGNEIRPQEAHFAVADADGHYQLDRLSPGRYRAMSLPQANTNDYLDPFFWIDHQEQTAAVTIEPGSSARVDLRILQPREAWR